MSLQFLQNKMTIFINGILHLLPCPICGTPQILPSTAFLHALGASFQLSGQDLPKCTISFLVFTALPLAPSSPPHHLSYLLPQTPPVLFLLSGHADDCRRACLKSSLPALLIWRSVRPVSASRCMRPNKSTRVCSSMTGLLSFFLLPTLAYNP